VAERDRAVTVITCRAVVLVGPAVVAAPVAPAVAATALAAGNGAANAMTSSAVHTVTLTAALAARCAAGRDEGWLVIAGSSATQPDSPPS